MCVRECVCVCVSDVVMFRRVSVVCLQERDGVARRQAAVKQGGDGHVSRTPLPSAAGRRRAGFLPFAATPGGDWGRGRDGSAQYDP